MKLGSRLLPLFLSVPLIGLAVFNLSQLMSDSPAFDASVRTPGIFGDWRVPIRSAYFDLADYQYQLAFGFLQTDVLVSGATEGPDEIASIDTIFDRSARAAELLNSSVALAPGNADAWAALGWAEAFSGDLLVARQAMRNSWSLAPYNLDLSFRRVSFYDFLAEVPIEDGDLTARSLEDLGARRDLETMSKLSPSAFAATIEDSATLRVLSETPLSRLMP